MIMPSVDRERWQQVSENLDRAFDLPEAERAAWLAELERTDPETGKRVAALLAAREEREFSGFLSEPVGVAPQPPPSVPLLGRNVGPYLIESEIGQGGMGTVWRAKRADGRFEGSVAIKFVHFAASGRGAEERFRHEGHLLARLNHPHIARLLDAGVLDGAHPYLVLEYVEGVPVDVYCDRENLGITARVRLFLDVLQAVAHAHSHLIVHRDIKPSNLIVTPEGTVKLLDFGVAKLLDDASRAGALSPATVWALTPQYAAPEQLLGQPVTTATDVYALGLVLYLLLTGKHPVPLESASTAELVMAITTLEPPRASQAVRDRRSRQRALEGDLDNILAKALKKDSAERYASVGAFAEDLRRYLRHEPVQARADTVAYRVTKFVRRHRGGVLATALAVAGLMGTTAVAIVAMLEARAQRDVAEFEARKNSAQSELTEFLLGDSLSRAPQDAVRQRLDRAREMVQQRFRTEPLIEARLLLGLSGRYVDTGDFAGSTETLRAVEAIAHRVDDPHLNADVACGRAQDEIEDGDLATARRELDSGLTNLHRMSAVPASLAAECAISAAYIAQAEGDFASSVSGLRSAVDDLGRAGLLRTARYQSVANELSRALYMTGDYRGSWDVQRQVLARATELGRTDTAGYYAEVSVAGASLRAGGQPRRALELIETALQHARQAGPDAQVPYYLEGGRAVDQFVTGTIDGIAEALETVAQAAEKDGAAHMALSYRVEALEAALAQHDVAGAQARWNQLAPVEAQLLANTVPDRDKVTLLLAHARLDLAQEDTTAAAHQLERAASVIASRRQPADSQEHEVELLRTELAFVTGAYAQAEQHAEVTLGLAKKEAIDPASSAWIGEALVWRARSEAALGRTAAAAASAREALPHLEQNLNVANPLIAAAKQLSNQSV